MTTIVQKQYFPLGRFHANPWKAFPFDDPYGEWPPSPWRLIRALVARSHQLAREEGGISENERTDLVRAFCKSSVRWHLPLQSWRGLGLRQYQPAQFSRVPKSAKEPGYMAHATTKTLDNYWLLNRAEEPVWWFIEGSKENWYPNILRLLDSCLVRMTYFGRAESIVLMERSPAETEHPEANCVAAQERTSHSVPVLFATPEATLADIERSTDEPEIAEATVPEGAEWRFAVRPARLPLTEISKRPAGNLRETALVQFAIGSRVSPSIDSAAILTNRFRGRAIKSLSGSSWSNLGLEHKESFAAFTGKHANGKPLEGHQHPFFALWFDPTTRKASRLLVWRRKPFSYDEQRALLKAAENPLTLGYNDKGKDPWLLHLIPLDSAVAPPAGFDANHSFAVWRSMTPFVPPHHIYDRHGNEKPGESLRDQILKELQNHGHLANVTIKVLANQWAKVHRSRIDRGNNTNADKRGHQVELTFSRSVAGPISLGHSCHFGLGLFVPAQ